MNLKDFYFDLPKELIAQTPLDRRDFSRLLVLSKETGEISHKHFYNIIDYLKPSDCLVINDTKVIPARLYGNKLTGASIEVLVLKEIKKDVFEVMVKPGKKVHIGDVINFTDDFKCEVIDICDGNRIVHFSYTDDNIYAALDRIGNMPLPPYITHTLDDKERYQTVYAKNLGSAAAPTAGLHFTDELLEQIRKKGVKILNVTLNVGLGTFRPVKIEDITKHKMHSEKYSVSQNVFDEIIKTKENGGRVIAVGTTSCRTLESIARNLNNPILNGETDIFIYPGYEFKIVDALITNFHLPESTLIMLICAFAGYENAMNAYKVAVLQNYRFFSFGDAMFIV